MKTNSKYEEALEKARKGMPIDEVFPELKESKDERIRKEIIEYLTVTCEKDLVGHPERQRWIAYLERQKENPKSADSIPSDCVSDAKCEDRWHKVTDSLPNKAREVLCKDAIGNFFIGRYYQKSQSWEVMMYDDCDKSNEHNPPVVKWCEIPAERQKEQKPVEWSEEDEFFRQQLIIYCENCVQDTLAAKCVDWLKSLRPQPQKLEDWTEEDETLLSDALGCVTMVEELKKRGELKNFHISCSGVELRSWIRSLKSRPRKQPH